MPKRKRVFRRRSFKPRKFRRSQAGSKRKTKKGRTRVSTSIIRQPSGISDRTLVKLRFSFDSTSTNTSGGFSSGVIKINDILDPAGTGGIGSAAYLYGQWAQFYLHSLVMGVKITVTAAIGPTNVSSTSNRSHSLTFSNDAIAPSSVAEVSMYPYSIVRTWAVNTKAPIIKSYMSVPKLLGLTREQYVSDPRYRGSFSTPSAPSVVTWAHIGTWDPYGGVTVNTFQTVYVTFYCMLFDRFAAAVSPPV